MPACSWVNVLKVRAMLDRLDRRLLAELQRDATASAQDLAQRLPLSPSQIGRRRQRLEAEGFVTGYRATLAPDRLGLSVEAFIEVTMAAHTEANARDFRALARRQPDVTGAWTLTGETDYLIRVHCEDLASLNRLVQDVLLPHPAVARVRSQIVMERVKPDAPLPIPEAP
jgi:DNA-binding Lrp family transcriptional regulator